MILDCSSSTTSGSWSNRNAHHVQISLCLLGVIQEFITSHMTRASIYWDPSYSLRFFMLRAGGWRGSSWFISLTLTVMSQRLEEFVLVGTAYNTPQNSTLHLYHNCRSSSICTVHWSGAPSDVSASFSHSCVHGIHFGSCCLWGRQVHVSYNCPSRGIAFPQGVCRVEPSRAGLCEERNEIYSQVRRGSQTVNPQNTEKEALQYMK